jgi:hypothetical protein
LDTDALNELLEGHMPPEPEFLINKPQSQNIPELESKSDAEPEPISDPIEYSGRYKCKHDECPFRTDELTTLMNHYKSVHKHKRKPRGKSKQKQDIEIELKSAIEPKYESINTDTEDIDNMGRKKKKKDGDEDYIEPEPQLEIEPEMEFEPKPEPEPEPKPKPKPKSKQIFDRESQVPTLIDRLQELLVGYRISRVPGILQSAQMYQIDTAGFIPVLKDLLRNSGVAPALINTITDGWSQIIGIKSEPDIVVPSTITKPPGPTTALDLMSQLRNEEINDTILESYKSKLEDKKLDNDIKRKRLSGESNLKPSTDIEQLKQKIYEQDKRLEIQTIQKQYDEKIAKLEAMISSSALAPKTDSQSELLKQQLTLLKQELLETRRKQDEDTKLAQIREEARRDRELLERKLEEQARTTQELLKTMQTASAPKTEDLLRQQMADMQRQFNEQIVKLNNDFLNTQREKEYKLEMERIKEESKLAKENTEGQISTLAESMKDFASNMTHAFEKSMIEREHERKEEELKKKITQMEHNKTLTNEQYAFERTQDLLKGLGEGIKGTIDSALSKAEAPAKHAAQVTAARDKVNLALDLKRQGFSNDQISQMLAEKQLSVPVVPRGSAQAEWQRMSNAVKDVSSDQSIQSPSQVIPPPSQPSLSTTDIDYSKHVEAPEPPIKFATSDKE